jgi:alkanesulfonate monooxygenase SsuD/methylene tetrahydromethanopterin reductase-like flavin-dependent oxidoreductase (luciferase family)
MPRVKFGVMLNHQYAPGEDIGPRIDEGVEQTELLRDLGYDLLFSHHHYLANLQTPQPVPILSHLVPYSGEMRLGIGIYIATLEHPVQLAETFATLDQISKGRVILGVGAGYREDEFKTFGIPIKTRLSRLYETLEITRRFWNGERVTFHGRHFDIEDQAISMLPAQRPRPQIWLGANSPKTIRSAAANADGWVSSPHNKFKWLNGNLADFKQAQRELGIETQDREYPAIRELYIADTDERARAEVEPYLSQEYQAFTTYDDVYGTHYEQYWEKSFLVGSPETVAERLEILAEGGWNTVIFRASWPHMPHEMTMRTIQRFADEVMPRFAKVAA